MAQNVQTKSSHNPAASNQYTTEYEEEEEEEDNPLLYVDVNLGPEQAERIVVYEGDTAEGLAKKFVIKHQLTPMMEERLVAMLQGEIDGLLSRIEEESSTD